MKPKMNKAERQELKAIKQNLEYSLEKHVNEGGRKQLIKSAINDIRILVDDHA